MQEDSVLEALYKMEPDWINQDKMWPAFEDLIDLDQEQRVAIEAKIVEAGFSVGKVDGMFESNTRTAIKELQQSLGAPITGYVDPRILNHIGLVWKPSEQTDFVNFYRGEKHRIEDLVTLEEDPRAINILKCLGSRKSIYGRFGNSFYFAVLETGGNDKSIDYGVVLGVAQRCGAGLATLQTAEENQFVFNMFSEDSLFLETLHHSSAETLEQGPYFGLSPYFGNMQSTDSSGQRWYWLGGAPLKFSDWGKSHPKNSWDVFASFRVNTTKNSSAENSKTAYWAATRGHDVVTYIIEVDAN